MKAQKIGCLVVLALLTFLVSSDVFTGQPVSHVQVFMIGWLGGLLCAVQAMELDAKRKAAQR